MYTLATDPRAESDLARLPSTIARRVRESLERLCENPDTEHHKALKGKHRGKFSLRVAKHYRIIYPLDRKTKAVIVHQIGHRSKVY